MKLQEALSHGTITIDSLEGATNLSYKAKLYRTLLCNIHAFLDNDDAGRKAIEDAEAAGAIHPPEYNLAVCKGMPESEFEDFIVLKSYEETVKREFGVLLDVRHFHNNKKKWSNRVKDCFENQGKVWSDKVEKRVKYVVAEAASTIGIESLNIHHRGPIDALIHQIEERIKMV